VSDERLYSEEEVIDLLAKAETIGLSLEAGSDLEKLTVGELDRLINVRQ
jgi:hypothetical protein